MPITPEDTYTKILNKLKNLLRTEFKNALPVYVGNEKQVSGTQYLRLEPKGSEQTGQLTAGEIREYGINMYYYFQDKNINISALEHVLRYTSRIEALVQNNRSTTLSDSSDLFNCKVESTELNALEEENEYVVLFVWSGQHIDNIS